MLSTTRIRVSNHGLIRYKQRFNQKADINEIREKIRLCRPAGKQLKKLVLAKCRGHKKITSTSKLTILVNDNGKEWEIFIIRWTRRGECYLITCFKENKKI